MSSELEQPSRSTARTTAVRTALITGAVVLGAGLFSQLFKQDNPTISVSAPSDASTAESLALPADTVPPASPETTVAGAAVTTPADSTAAVTASSTTASTTASTASTAAVAEPTSTVPATTTTIAPSTTATGASTTVAPADATTTTAGISLSPGQTPCPPTTGNPERVATFTVAPPMCIDVKAKYRASVKTSEGVLTISLDSKNYPNTVNNFVYLARYKFYDGLSFHRVVPNFIIQGGDPLGTGRGSAGYEFADELTGKAEYTMGAVAMANGRPDQPNTNGSQFFIVVGDLGKQLKQDFPQFGRVVDGTSVLRKIAALGPDSAVDQSGKPSKPVTIESITITARGEKVG
jgi:cyclophilin family peptidyl-prolyl cis-trans isomerase